MYSPVSEWSVCEVRLYKHSPVMFTQHQAKGTHLHTDMYLESISNNEFSLAEKRNSCEITYCVCSVMVWGVGNVEPP